MIIFWRLVLAHFIADFTFQTNHIANWKRESKWGMAVHVLTHPLTSMICVVLPTPGSHGLNFSYLTMNWVETRWFSLNGSVCILLLALFHWLEDEWRVWSIQKTGSPDSTAFFLWDQLVHITLILAFAPTWPGIHADAWVFVVLCAVLLSHFTSVLIFFLENDLWGTSQILNNRKYYFMAERLVGASLFLLPGAWLLLAMGWLGWIVYVHYRQAQDRTWVNLVVGNVSAAFLGLITRGLLS
jgi:hypothetical protein